MTAEHNPSLKHIAAKMLRVMADISFIRKSGYNEFLKYRYATEADISSACSQAMQEHGVFMFSSIVNRHCETYQTRQNKSAFMVTVELAVTFVDADSGESFTATFFGDGSDFDDKGVYKAITGAQKYALMKTLLVATGDDPEREQPRSRTKLAGQNADTAALKAKTMKALEQAAAQGIESLRQQWKRLTTEERYVVQDQLDVLKDKASQIEATQKPQEDITC